MVNREVKFFTATETGSILLLHCSVFLLLYSVSNICLLRLVAKIYDEYIYPVFLFNFEHYNLFLTLLDKHNLLISNRHLWIYIFLMAFLNWHYCKPVWLCISIGHLQEETNWWCVMKIGGLLSCLAVMSDKTRFVNYFS